jgi:predicted transcriptional regulator
MVPIATKRSLHGCLIDMLSQLAIMSIRPCFARSIYAGDKHYEFRRARVRLRSGDMVVLYETAPIGRLTGRFTVGVVVVDAPTSLPGLESDAEQQTAAALYLAGARIGTAIEIIDPKQWATSCYLSDFGLTHAPRSYRFL